MGDVEQFDQVDAAEVAIPLDHLLNEAALGLSYRFRPRTATLRLGLGLLKDPVNLVQRLGGLGTETLRVVVGRSEVAPDPRDRRFADPEWSENPILRRVLQSYLAAGKTTQDLLADVELSYEDRERADFLIRNIIEGLAPSNSPILNPTARKRLVESRGRSAAAGVKNFASDMKSAPRVPSMVPADSFEVGKDLAITPGSVVFRNEMFELIQYRPTTDTVVRNPVLVVPPVINKYYAVDLAPGKSLIEYLVAQGLQPFVISWRNPTAEHRDWGMDAYGAAILDALRIAKRITRAPKVNVYAICSGGILAAMALSHLQRTGQLADVAGLSLAVTVLDQHHAGLASSALNRQTADLAIAVSAARGYLDGRNLAEAFAWLRPTDLIWNYWINNYLAGREPPKFDVLFWNADTTRMSAALHRDFVMNGVTNALARQDEVTMLGTGVDLSALDVDGFVVAGVADHICPWQAVYASARLLGGHTEFVLSTSGHIASLINPPGNPKARYLTGTPDVADADAWRRTAESREGSWWPDFAAWLTERGAGTKKAPRSLGNKDFPPLADAPGTYVMES